MTKKRQDSENARAILAALSREERRALLEELLMREARAADARWPIGDDLGKAEAWFRKAAQLAATPRQKNSRLRMLLIFLLLRYGGMKITEIFALEASSFDLANGLVRLKAPRAREVPLPWRVARQMRHLLDSWPAQFGMSKPLLCDASHVRRALRQCALEIGLEPKSLNASALRKFRALELESGGMHTDLLNIFLGRCRNSSLFRAEEAPGLIKLQIHKEERMKTSARNLFNGKIISLKQQGILVEVILETAEGLKVTAVITETSRKSLNLDLGMPVNAMVKAPWVTALPGKGLGEAAMSAENCFAGMVEDIEQDELAAEILVALPEGNLICALYALGATPPAGLVKGAQAVVCFSAFSVILSLD